MNEIKPFTAPTQQPQEMYHHYLSRIARAFETWVNTPPAPAPQGVDPDLIEARKVAAACPHVPDGRAAYISAGERDNDNTVRGALAGIKKGRELERAALASPHRTPLDDRG